MTGQVLLIVAFTRFQEKEYDPPKEILTKAGYRVVIASSRLGTATGKVGGQAPVDLTLDQVKPADFDAVCFIGGPGSFDYYDDPTCHQIARDTVTQGKLLAAICAAPGILARAGVLKGKKATMFDDTGEIARGGGTFVHQGVVIDGRLITADGPATARAWAEAIVTALHGQ
ncbi:MAG: DJ-1/PfpI family protein [Candidatus Margulisbacteria bacterium]|jgi:protease I|nr:DJ-1/PfpI family protein [Candidatus Margulisiibacteriota bacterium]